MDSGTHSQVQMEEYQYISREYQFPVAGRAA